jgi:PRTRC genetic system protein B
MSVRFQANQSYRLTNAVLVYQDAQRKPAFVSVHDVGSDDGNRPVIQAGVPASKSGLLALMRILDPETLLKPAHQAGACARRRIGILRLVQRPQGQAGLVRLQGTWGAHGSRVPCPGLVFVVTTKAWKVFAYKGRQRPDAETPLFVAPFFNVWNTGRSASGVPGCRKAIRCTTSEAWEEAFFRSYFTHPNIHTPRGLTRYRAGPFALWRDLLDGRLTHFPTRTLVSTGWTLRQAFEAPCWKREA